MHWTVTFGSFLESITWFYPITNGCTNFSQTLVCANLAGYDSIKSSSLIVVGTFLATVRLGICTNYVTIIDSWETSDGDSTRTFIVKLKTRPSPLSMMYSWRHRSPPATYFHCPVVCVLFGFDMSTEAVWPTCFQVLWRYTFKRLSITSILKLSSIGLSKIPAKDSEFAAVKLGKLIWCYLRIRRAIEAM